MAVPVVREAGLIDRAATLLTEGGFEVSREDAGTVRMPLNAGLPAAIERDVLKGLALGVVQRAGGPVAVIGWGESVARWRDRAGASP